MIFEEFVTCHVVHGYNLGAILSNRQTMFFNWQKNPRQKITVSNYTVFNGRGPVTLIFKTLTDISLKVFYTFTGKNPKKGAHFLTVYHREWFSCMPRSFQCLLKLTKELKVYDVKNVDNFFVAFLIVKYFIFSCCCDSFFKQRSRRSGNMNI